MNFGKQFLSFYVNSSIHVALAVCAFVILTAIEFELNVSKALIGFAFFGTVFGYNFIKKNETENILSLVSKSRQISFISVLVLLFIGTVLLMFQLSYEAIFVTIILAFLTLLYAVPFLKNKSLRHFNGLKIFIVALVWVGVTVLIPYLNEFTEIPDDLVVVCIQRFFLVLALILPFEIRDLSVDASYLKTLPQQVGVIPTKIIGMVLLMLCFFLEFMKDTFNEAYFFSLVCILILLALLIVFAQKKQSKYFASFWVESIPIVWIFLLLLFKSFI